MSTLSSHDMFALSEEADSIPDTDVLNALPNPSELTDEDSGNILEMQWNDI